MSPPTISRISISEDFTKMPGPRKRVEGDWSGEQFFEERLLPAFDAALRAGSQLQVDLDGVAGYPTSFLEEAFGGLARKYGAAKVLEILDVACNDEPYLLDEIKRYIREAHKK